MYVSTIEPLWRFLNKPLSFVELLANNFIKTPTKCHQPQKITVVILLRNRFVFFTLTALKHLLKSNTIWFTSRSKAYKHMLLFTFQMNTFKWKETVYKVHYLHMRIQVHVLWNKLGIQITVITSSYISVLFL